MTTARTCAFCDQPVPLTREHVWPRCIIERTPKYTARYIGQAQKFIKGEATVKDVCAECNNGVLSALDDYICQLYGEQLFRIALARQSRTFLFNFPLLLRWLLKASYNAARANHSDVVLLSRYAPFILHGGAIPEGVEVRLELIHPSKARAHPPSGRHQRELLPQSVRCCRIEIPANPVTGMTLRLVAINSYYFWLVFGAPKGSSLPFLPGKPLSPQANRLTAFPSRGAIEAHADWVLDPKANAAMMSLQAQNAG